MKISPESAWSDAFDWRVEIKPANGSVIESLHAGAAATLALMESVARMSADVRWDQDQAFFDSVGMLGADAITLAGAVPAADLLSGTM